jgi:molybdopterin converting factor small subunit
MPVSIAVELFGAPRLLAKAPSIDVDCQEPVVVRELLRGLEAACPPLRGRVLRSGDGTLVEGFLLSVNGRRFVEDLGETLTVGDHLLLFSAAAGG